MEINNYLKPIDNAFTSINKNKGLLLLLLILVVLYLIYSNEYVNEYMNEYMNEYAIEHATNLFTNNLFKLIVFIIITYIASYRPMIGLGLAIIMLLSLQIITNLKLKKEIGNEKQKEKFSQMNPADISYFKNEFLENPLLTEKNLSPPINLDLKPITPTEYYIEMIKKGKILLDDSYHIEKDLISRPDDREKQIAMITKNNGSELVESGINRLQKANNGEYNFETKQNNKFIKYIDSNNNYFTDPSVIASYNELMFNYDKLQTIKDSNNFNTQLNKVYQSKLELLESIYRITKTNTDISKQNLIDNLFAKIKQLKTENKNWNKELENLSELLCL